MSFLKKPDGSFSWGSLFGLLSAGAAGIAKAAPAPEVSGPATALAIILGTLASTVH